jgi:hypothetical protein
VIPRTKYTVEQKRQMVPGIVHCSGIGVEYIWKLGYSNIFRMCWKILPLSRLVSLYQGTEAALLWNFANVSLSIGGPDVASIINGLYPIGYFFLSASISYLLEVWRLWHSLVAGYKNPSIG